MISSIGLAQLIRNTNGKRSTCTGYKIDPDDFKDWPLDNHGNPIRRYVRPERPMPPDSELTELQQRVKFAIETGTPVTYIVPKDKGVKQTQLEVHGFARRYGKSVRCKKGDDWRVFVITRREK